MYIASWAWLIVCVCVCVLEMQAFTVIAYNCLQNIESSPVLDTSCLTEQIYELINRQFLCVKSPKPVTIQYLLIV